MNEEKHNYSGPTPEESEFINLVVSYEAAKESLAEAKTAADSILLQQSRNNVINPVAIITFKKKRDDNWAKDEGVVAALVQFRQASLALDSWLTNFVVNKLDENPKEFIFSRTNKAFSITLVRIEGEYHIIKGGGLPDLLNKISILTENTLSEPAS